MPRKFPMGVDAQSNRVINVADPTASQDAATKLYVDNKIDGLAYKDEVRVATTTNGTLASAYVNGQTVDGITLATGDRILLKNQTAQAENGIYLVAASGAPARSSDMNASAEFNNATVYVTEGTANGGTEWTQAAKNPTVGTTAIVFTQKSTGLPPTSGSGAISVAGQAVSFVPKSGGMLAQDGSGAYVDLTAMAARVVTKYAANIGDGSTTAITVTHNLGTKDRVGEPLVFIVSSGEVIEPDIVIGTNADTVTFTTAPATNSIRYCTAA